MQSLIIKASRIKKRLKLNSYGVIDQLFGTDFKLNYSYKIIGFHTTDYRFDENQIAFIHLPKSGGTSFYQVLQQDLQNRFVNLKTHRPISIHCPPDKYRYITIMRHPVDRVWSYYQMVLRSPKGYPYSKYADQGLEHFIKHCWEVRNMACRYYSGNVKEEPDQQTWEKAFKQLKSFYAVLSFEHFSLVAVEFFKAHDLNFEELPHKRKVQYPHISPKEKSIILQFNQLDLQLYEQWSQYK